MLRVHKLFHDAPDLMAELWEFLGEDPVTLIGEPEGTEVEKPAHVPTILPQPTRLTPPTTTRKSPSPRDSTLIFDAPSRMGHRVTDYHPTAEPEATRLVKRKLADLRSHASTRTPDDGPPLIHMARPVWDPSDPLDIDTPAYKRATSGYPHETTYNRPTVEPEVVRPMKRRKFASLHSHGSSQTPDDTPQLMAHTVPELSGLPGLKVPACKRLINGPLSQTQVISLIKAIFTSKDEVAMIRDLRGDDAQTFVDVVNEVCSFVFFGPFKLSPSVGQALDLPDLHPLLRGRCLRALYRICGRHGLLPRSLQTPPCHDRSGAPLYRGGFADVWRGEYQGRNVAVKVLRLYSTSDAVKIRFVGSQPPRSITK